MEGTSLILVNLLPIKTGGGLQNALSFLTSIKGLEFSCIVREGTLLEKKCRELNFNFIAVKDNLLSRLIFEIKVRFLFPKGTRCFTYFGPPLLGSIGKFHNINGFAYSNLLYPNLDFWWWCGFTEKIKKNLIDIYRLKISCFSDEIIFETDLLYRKAYENKNFQGVKKHVVQMSPSKLVLSEDNLDKKKYEVFNFNDSSLVLYLSGPHPNKRIIKLIDIAKVLKEESLEFKFVLTLPESNYTKQIFNQIQSNSLNDYFINIGPVEQQDVSSLIYSVDAMINIAVLESFSNNVVEAWSMNKPLIITDDEWARESCKDAASYIDIESRESISTVFSNLSNADYNSQKIRKGTEMLDIMPSLEDKNRMYKDIILGNKI